MALEDRLYPLLSLYERSPQWAKTIVGSCYSLLPQHVRLGRRYGEFCELAQSFQTSTPEEIAAWQTGVVRRMLTHAYETCPFYKRHYDDHGVSPKDFTRLSDITRFPYVEKKHLQDFREEFVSSAVPANQRLLITTGGSTGVPVGFYLQKGVSRTKEQAFLEAMWKRASWKPQVRMAVIRGHVTKVNKKDSIAAYEATRNWLILSSSHLDVENFPDYRKALEKFRPKHLHAYPSAALMLAELVAKSGRPLSFPLTSILCGSESLPLNQKRILEEAFQCRIYRWYGHSERVVLAGEGTTSELLYFFPQYGYVEFGEADEGGLQEIVGTSFHNFAMPLIRYRTGDLAKVTDGTEFPWPAVSRIVGRQQEFVVSKTGRKVSLTAINMHDEIFAGLYAVQFFQEKLGVLDFRYVAGPTFSPAQIPVIERGLLRKLGEGFELTLRAVSETEKTARGKHRWLVSKI